MISNNRNQQEHNEIKNHQVYQDPPQYMNCTFNTKEFEEALKTLKDKKSPGPDRITNEMLEHLGAKAKSKLWESSVTSGRQGMFLRAGETLTWYPSTRRASSEQTQTAIAQQPHQLCGQTHEKIDQHSPGMAPGEQKHHHSGAGRLPAASFYWRPGGLHCPEGREWLSG